MKLWMIKGAAKAGLVQGLALFMLAAAITPLSAPVSAYAQFSKSYKFLESVRKKEGSEVQTALDEPGTTIVNTHDSTNGETALHIVTARRDITWMNFLIAKGASVDSRDVRGVTPLQIAVNLGFTDGVDLLLGEKAKVDDRNSQGESALIVAVHRRNLPIMRMLLKAGADPDRADNSGRSARDYAMLEGRASSLVSEIETSAKPKAQRATAKPSYGPKF